MQYILREVYLYLVIVVLFAINYLLLRYVITKKNVNIKRPTLYSVVFTVSYLLIVVLNLLSIFPKINKAIDGYEMVWFDTRGIVLFVIAGYIVCVPLYLFVINKIFPISGIRPLTWLTILYSVNTAVLLIHQRIYLLLK